MNDDLIMLLEMGLTPAEAVDFLATEEHGYTQGEWAKTRGVGRQAVNNNVRKAEEKIQGHNPK